MSETQFEKVDEVFAHSVGIFPTSLWLRRSTRSTSYVLSKGRRSTSSSDLDVPLCLLSPGGDKAGCIRKSRIARATVLR